jgi:hypothetical protein
MITSRLHAGKFRGSLGSKLGVGIKTMASAVTRSTVPKVWLWTGASEKLSISCTAEDFLSTGEDILKLWLVLRNSARSLLKL